MTTVAVGDEVIGWVDTRSSQAEYAVVEAANLAPKPAAVPWQVAGVLPVAGFTAWAAVRAVALSAGDTLVVSEQPAGSGRSRCSSPGDRCNRHRPGQRAEPRLAGRARRRPGGLRGRRAGRIHSIAPKADAFIDTYGGDYVELALGELGVPPDRVDTIVRFDAIEKYGVKSEGNAVGASAAVLAELAA